MPPLPGKLFYLVPGLRHDRTVLYEREVDLTPHTLATNCASYVSARSGAVAAIPERKGPPSGPAHRPARMVDSVVVEKG